jgi:hypothetical protein
MGKVIFTVTGISKKNPSSMEEGLQITSERLLLYFSDIHITIL